MPFGTITGSIAGQTFEPRTPGIYSLSTLTFSDPSNELRLSGATSRKDGSRGGSMTRLFQKDVTVAGSLVREQAVVTLNVTIPKSGTFTATELDALIADISLFVTPTTLSRFLQGES